MANLYNVVYNFNPEIEIYAFLNEEKYVSGALTNFWPFIQYAKRNNKILNLVSKKNEEWFNWRKEANITFMQKQSAISYIDLINLASNNNIK